MSLRTRFPSSKICAAGDWTVVLGFADQTVMLDPFKYEDNDGYQLTSALTSIGNGGLTGKGLGNGIAKLGYLPEPHTDFIFTVISEELGLLGVLFTLTIYGYLLVKGLIYANKTNNQFYKNFN